LGVSKRGGKGRRSLREEMKDRRERLEQQNGGKYIDPAPVVRRTRGRYERGGGTRPFEPTGKKKSGLRNNPILNERSVRGGVREIKE